MSFLSELKRRRVVRAGLVYVAAAFAAVQAADALIPALGLPDWIVRAVAIGGVAGLPVAIVLAWVFEFSADGVRVTDDSSSPAVNVRWLDVRTLPPRHRPLLKEPRYQRIVERARAQQKELRARLAAEVSGQ